LGWAIDRNVYHLNGKLRLLLAEQTTIRSHHLLNQVMASGIPACQTKALSQASLSSIISSLGATLDKGFISDMTEARG
jgi:hypothetical protein